jgi:hypothetical protein
MKTLTLFATRSRVRLSRNPLGVRLPRSLTSATQIAICTLPPEVLYEANQTFRTFPRLRRVTRHLVNHRCAA